MFHAVGTIVTLLTCCWFSLHPDAATKVLINDLKYCVEYQHKINQETFVL